MIRRRVLFTSNRRCGQLSQFSRATDDCGGAICFARLGASGPATTVVAGAAVIVATLPMSPGASFILAGASQVAIGLTGPGGIPLQVFTSGIQR